MIKIESHRRFWKEGPSLLARPDGIRPLYDTVDYDRRFADPELMWRLSAAGRAL